MQSFSEGTHLFPYLNPILNMNDAVDVQNRSYNMTYLDIMCTSCKIRKKTHGKPEVSTLTSNEAHENDNAKLKTAAQVSRMVLDSRQKSSKRDRHPSK